MPKMLFDLTDDEREALEHYRARMGLRSFTAAVKHLIHEADQQTVLDLARAGDENTKAMLRESRARPKTPQETVMLPPSHEMKAADPEAARAWSSTVPLAGTFECKPYQKGMGKAKK